MQPHGRQYLCAQTCAFDSARRVFFVVVQPQARERVAEQDHRASAFVRDDLHGAGQLVCRARPQSKDIFECIDRMGPHQHRRIGADVTFGQDNVVGPGDLIRDNPHIPFPAIGRSHCAAVAFHQQIVMLVAIGDQVADRADLEAVCSANFHQVRQAGHSAVFFHDFANHA